MPAPPLQPKAARTPPSGPPPGAPPTTAEGGDDYKDYKDTDMVRKFVSERAKLKTRR